MEKFESYFRRADVDNDGKISGSEAVNFFQGSNLPKPVLAQIWMHADKSRTGFLSREEFYNALKLVTVAQSKRELTPDIVKAALFGPAATKIPPPQINMAAISAPQLTSSTAAPTPTQQMGAVGQVGSQNYGSRGQAPPNTSMNQQYFPAQNNQSMRSSPPTPAGAGAAARPQLGFNNSNIPRGGVMTGPGIQNSSMSNDWLGGRTGGASVTTTMPTSASGSALMPPVASNPLDSLSTTSLTLAKDPKSLGGSGSRPALDSTFGSDLFSASQSTPKQTSNVLSNFANSTPSSAIVPASTISQPMSKPDPFEMLQSTYTRPPLGTQQQQTQSLPKPNQQVSAPVSVSSQQSRRPAATSTFTSEQSQSPWPKMTAAGVQKYAKVFMEVDTDRDGRITGEEARNLFMSWKLPREILKQVWDLSDHDGDSMLSLREFCVALYMMERYREGRSLPPSLPPSVMLDETLLSMAGPPASGYGAVGWGTAPGLRPPQVLPENQPTHTGGRLPMPGSQSLHSNHQNTRISSNDNNQVYQHSNGKQTPSMTGQETDTETEGERSDKMILDSKEKLEYYRSKMQDLVLYKSRCDNRLNEITERALADKREAEMLGKKYEEKYKQVAEIASKLTIEEASFREIQGRKTELQEAIKKMEQGGSADGILQVRADRIQSDLEELLKALAERCKKHKVDLKSAAIIELPPGWQPGIPEVAAVWDEDWDKFEDEGFSFDVAISSHTKAQSPQSESSPTHSYSSDAEAHSESTSNKGSNILEVESAFTHSEDESKSAQASPRQETSESLFGEYSDNHFSSSFDEDAEAHRSFDDPSWGTFDNNDDIDSVWGFNVKDPDHAKDDEKYFFDSNNSVSSPTRMDSPRTDDYTKNNSFFTDSVPGSPQSRAGNSPRYSVGSVDPFFDGFSRFDSFRTNDLATSPRKESFTRFDSINSSRGFDFDDSDPFGSSGPFKVSSESQNSKKDSDSWNAF